MTTVASRAKANRSPRGRAAFANRLVIRLLTSGAVASDRLAVLRYTARTATVVLPVQAARHDAGVVVHVGNANSKRWWRHFRRQARVEVFVDGQWHAGSGQVVAGADSPAAAAYRHAFPRATLPADATFVVVTFDHPAPAPPALRGGRLFRAWLLTVTAAEFVGFAVPAAVGALTAAAAPALAAAALLAAGAVEGAILGWGQARVLRRALPAISGRRWIGATAAAAVLAYAIGLMPSTFAAKIESWPRAAIVLAAAVSGAVLLSSIGTAQWLVLRRQLARSAGWIWATALAWLVGLGTFLGLAMPLWRPGQALALTVAIGIGGGLVMAAAMATVTGVALRRLLR